MSPSQVRTYFELAESYYALTEAMRGGQAIAADVEQAARRALAGLSRDAMSKVGIWHVDWFYRLLHRLDMLDGASMTFVRALGVALREALAREKVGVAYLVDNQIAADRWIPCEAFFNAMGVVVASPEILSVKLAKADGVEVDDPSGPHLARYLAEATHVAEGLFTQVIAERRPVIWLSGACALEVYQRLGGRLDGTSYVGAFRNRAPEDGSAIQVFRSATEHHAIDPND